MKGRLARSKERTPETLKNNQEFFEQFGGKDLELVRQTYNFVIQKVNWQGRNFTVDDNLNQSETQEGLARKLTEFQDGVDNLDK